MTPFPLRLWANQLLIALNLLTRLPVPNADWSDTSRPAAQAAWAYPLAGLCAALPALLVAYICQAIYMEGAISAGLFLVALIFATGALHEDGLADCADGFWGGWDKARRLEIMKDSAIGTYGVLALITIIGIKWAALTYWLGFWMGITSLIAPVMLSRAAMCVVMQALPHARADGLSHQTGQPGWKVVTVAVLSAALASFLVLATDAFLLCMLVTTAVTVMVAYVARIKIGGQTGDVLGATQQLSEMAVLVTLCTLYSGAHFDPV